MTHSGKEVITLDGHSDVVRCIAFSPDGRRLASGCLDHTIKLWDVRTGHELITLRDHTDAVIALAFSPDGELLVSGSSDGTVKLWTTERSAVAARFPLTGPCDKVGQFAVGALNSP